MIKAFNEMIDTHEKNCFLQAKNMLNPDTATRETLAANKRQSRQLLESSYRLTFSEAITEYAKRIDTKRDLKAWESLLADIESGKIDGINKDEVIGYIESLK